MSAVNQNDDSISYEPKIVAYLDILGYRSMVSQSRDKAIGTILSIKESINFVLKMMRDRDKDGWVSIKTFSDYFCLTTTDTVDYLDSFLDSVAFLQYHLAINGIYVRGGISKGYHYETSDMIFSQGLVNAYGIQADDPYPRVLVSKNLAQDIIARKDCYRPFDCCSGGHQVLKKYLLWDHEGKCFLDYLQTLWPLDLFDQEDLLLSHAKKITMQLNKNKANESVLKKYLWASAYHNFRCAEIVATEDYDSDYCEEWFRKLYLPMYKPENEFDAKNFQFTRNLMYKDVTRSNRLK